MTVEKAISILESKFDKSCGNYRYQNAEKLDFEDALWMAITALREKKERENPVDAVPVVHGQWKRVISTHFLECSECGKPLYVHSIAYTHRNFCPNCGAKMDKED